MSSKYVVQELHEPESIGPEFRELYSKFAKRILWIDDNEVPGAFQMNTAWYKKPQPRDPLFDEHVHDYDEIIGFFGGDPEDPYNLHGLVEFWLDGEKQVIDRTSLLFAPAGMKHGPLRLLEVDQPIFHFSVVSSPEYLGESTYAVK